MRFDETLAQVLRTVEIAYAAIEVSDDLARDFFRAFGQRDDQEIVAADVPDEVFLGAAAPNDVDRCRREETNGFVPVRESVHVVEGFEVVEIHIQHGKGRVGF